MKKLIAVLSALSIAFGMTLCANAADYLGDVDKSGEVNSSDALTVLEYSVGIKKEIDEKLADITKDGQINSSDALNILKTAVGILELQTAEEDVNPDDPTTYDKAQLVDYYNQCLKNTYSQPKFTVTKTEKINVQLGEMLLNGKPAKSLQNIANKVVASNAAKGGTKTANFTDKNAVVDARERFILPTSLTADGVKSYNISKNGSGYVVVITLVEESCDFTTKPPHNRSCTFPLDFTEIDLGSLGQITSAEFYYPGTVLTADIDENGRVTKTFVNMPLTVNDAKGKGMGQELQLDISGSWECTNVFKF